MKIASGKFQGEIATNTPRPRNAEPVALAGRPGQLLQGPVMPGAPRWRSNGRNPPLRANSASASSMVLPASLWSRASSRARLFLHEIGEVFQCFRAGLDRGGVPGTETGACGLHRRLDLGLDPPLTGLDHRADAAAPVIGREALARLAFLVTAIDDRHGFDRLPCLRSPSRWPAPAPPPGSRIQCHASSCVVCRRDRAARAVCL